MRTRTDKKRQEILAAAASVFEEVGYQRASMAAISARLGGSKATLYGYFNSKETLFAAVMTGALEEQGQRVADSLDDESGDVEDVLRTFGERYLALISSPEVLAVMRTAMIDGVETDLGAELYRLGPYRGLSTLAAYLEKQIRKGVLRTGDPEVVAYHLRGLLEAGVLEPILFGLKPAISIPAAVDGAIDAFFRAYGPAGSPAR